MKLHERINDRKVFYTFRKEESIAFEIALLYFIMGMRKKAHNKLRGINLKAVFWLEKANVLIPEYLSKLSPEGQLEEIQKILVFNKAKIGARRCQPVLAELCCQFGLV